MRLGWLSYLICSSVLALTLVAATPTILLATGPYEIQDIVKKKPPVTCAIDEVEPCGDPCPANPGEIGGVGMSDRQTLFWTDDVCITSFNVYRAPLFELKAGGASRCHGSDVVTDSFQTPADPTAGETYAYLVTGETNTEGTPGDDSFGAERPLLGSCDTILRNHVMDRVSYGYDEWSSGEIETLGLVGYINQQLDPDLIDESTNSELIARKTNIEPPETITELRAIDLVNAVYARRQLEQLTTIFWSNHFNTDYTESFDFFFFVQNDPDPNRRAREATLLQYEELQQFRSRAFTGNFREILEDSGLGPAMIIYLDTVDNKAVAPNENYGRELMELHTLGVDGGYTQGDIVEMARVFSGWYVCKKEPANLNDPLAPCIPQAEIDGIDEPDGDWVAHFRTNFHDCGSKTLFADNNPDGEVPLFIPDTCSDPDLGVNDATLVFDALAAHPATAPFISKKLLEKFVTDTPTREMIDSVVAVWNDGINPQGIGDLRAVLAAVLDQVEFLDPDTPRNKIKTPIEHLASGFRAIRGNTDGISLVIGYENRMGHTLHDFPVPTGFPERGDLWLDTNNLLERQKFGMQVARNTGSNFGGDVIALLGDAGISTGAGNADAIVDFFVDILFGGAITPTERQAAVDYLNTDDNGVPSNYSLGRIREAVGFLMGYGQFLEQ